MRENRDQIIESCLNVVLGISDKEYQKKIWIRGEGPEIDDFDESVCNFFQDGEGIIKNYKDFGITETQYQTLVNFRDKFDAFCSGPALNYYSPEEFIDTPEWAEIMSLAKDVLKAFNYPKN